MSKSQKKAHKNYEKKRIMKPISFNTETEKELLEFANSVDFSNWVKQKIKDEVSVQKTCNLNEKMLIYVKWSKF